MTPQNLEWLHETLKRLGKIMADEWAKNEALTIILKENGVCNVEERVKQVLVSHTLDEKAQQRFQPMLDQLEEDAKAAWIEAESNNPPPKLPPSRVV
jgi:hypothetical protein